MSDAGDVAEPASVAIACSLSTGELRTRLEEWQELLRQVTERQSIEGGLRLTLSRSAARAAIADLAIREHACCPFLDFTVDSDTEAPVLEVRGPPAAEGIIRELLVGAAERLWRYRRRTGRISSGPRGGGDTRGSHRIGASEVILHVHDHSITDGVDDEELALKRCPRDVAEPRPGEAQHDPIAGPDQFQMIDASAVSVKAAAHVVQDLLAISTDEARGNALVHDLRI